MYARLTLDNYFIDIHTHCHNPWDFRDNSACIFEIYCNKKCGSKDFWKIDDAWKWLSFRFKDNKHTCWLWTHDDIWAVMHVTYKKETLSILHQKKSQWGVRSDLFWLQHAPQLQRLGVRSTRKSKQRADINLLSYQRKLCRHVTWPELTLWTYWHYKSFLFVCENMPRSENLYVCILGSMVTWQLKTWERKRKNSSDHEGVGRNPIR